jgi:protein TonB
VARQALEGNPTAVEILRSTPDYCTWSGLPAAAQPPSANALVNFQRSLLTYLEQAKHYPGEAQQRGEEGIVYLRLTIDRSGQVLSTGIDRSSGFPDLDNEALAMIERAQPLPAIPPEIAQSQLQLSIPVRFSLR